MLANAYKRLKERGINPEPVFKLAIPILEAGADERREELQRLWEALLAAALDPNKQGFVRQSLISTVKQLDPFDALVFDEIRNNAGDAAWASNPRDSIASKLGATADEVQVSVDNLHRLNLIVAGGTGLWPLGNLLVRVLT
jgi:Abortive infection alpha